MRRVSFESLRRRDSLEGFRRSGTRPCGHCALCRGAARLGRVVNGHPTRPLSGPTAHFYLRALELIAAGTKTLPEFHPRDRAMLDYALRSRAEQAASKHKHPNRFAAGGRIAGPQKAHCRYTVAGLQERLQRVARRLGRTPARRELARHRLPSSDTWRYYFGSYRKACLAAGLRPNPGGHS